MKIKLKKTKCSVSSSEIEDFERQFGEKLPEDYKHFLANYNGAKPASNIFRGNESVAVSGFIPFDQLLKEHSLIANEVPEKVIPIAWDSCGNYVCLDLEQAGAVLFWDHEEPDNLTRLAGSFSEFCDMLDPFDVSKVELKPGQVISAWIDPSLLK